MVPTTDAISRVVAHLVSRNPDLIGRIGRAHRLVQAGAVSWQADHGVHLVASGSTPGLAYRVSLAGQSCECPDQADRHAPRGWCKHLLSVAIVGMAARYQARQLGRIAATAEAREWCRLLAVWRQQQRAVQVA